MAANISNIIKSIYDKTNTQINTQTSATNQTSNSFTVGLDNFIDTVYTNELRDEMSYFNKQLFQHFHPDINGYSLLFFMPPTFALYDESSNTSYQDFILDYTKLIAFAAIDYSPPQTQIQSERVSSRSGGIAYATEVVPTDQLSITYIDDTNLSIYKFHLFWATYIKQLLEGIIEVPENSEYMEYSENNDMYGALDYAASAYIVKYDTSMRNIQYVGKATGIFPQSLPNKELIGQRSANEVTTLPFIYFCSYYDEAMDSSHQIWKELEGLLPIYIN